MNTIDLRVNYIHLIIFMHNLKLVSTSFPKNNFNTILLDHKVNGSACAQKKF